MSNQEFIDHLGLELHGEGAASYSHKVTKRLKKYLDRAMHWKFLPVPLFNLFVVTPLRWFLWVEMKKVALTQSREIRLQGLKLRTLTKEEQDLRVLLSFLSMAKASSLY